jgi:hypothetical protein
MPEWEILSGENRHKKQGEGAKVWREKTEATLF